MTERKLLISGLTLGYEGLFDSPDLFKFIDDWFKTHGYDKNEIKNIEKITEKGKQIQIEEMPFREINDYTKFEIYVKIRIANLVETKIKRQGKEFKINKGDISISIDCFLATDIRHRWEGHPFRFFLRTIFTRFINREYIRAYEQRLVEDVQNFHNELKSYLNLNRYTEQA